MAIKCLNGYVEQEADVTFLKLMGNLGTGVTKVVALASECHLKL